MKKEHIYYLIVILLVVSLGMFALNQTFSWYYKLDLLTNPCDACLEYNEHYASCFNEKSRAYLDTEGNPIKKIKINLSDVTSPTQ